MGGQWRADMTSGYTTCSYRQTPYRFGSLGLREVLSDVRRDALVGGKQSLNSVVSLPDNHNNGDQKKTTNVLSLVALA